MVKINMKGDKSQWKKKDDWNSTFLQFSMYIHTLLFWVSVSLYPKNDKMAEPIGSIFLCGTSHDPIKGFMDAQNYKNLCTKIFVKI